MSAFSPCMARLYPIFSGSFQPYLYAQFVPSDLPTDVYHTAFGRLDMGSQSRGLAGAQRAVATLGPANASHWLLVRTQLRPCPTPALQSHSNLASVLGEAGRHAWGWPDHESRARAAGSLARAGDGTAMQARRGWRGRAWRGCRRRRQAEAVSPPPTHPTAAALAVCRMGPGASHPACGLPTELANFQGEVQASTLSLACTCEAHRLPLLRPLPATAVPPRPGYYECADAVKVGRPKSVEEVQTMVRPRGWLIARATACSGQASKARCGPAATALPPPLSPQVGMYPRVKASGVGHSWFKAMFCERGGTAALGRRVPGARSPASPALHCRCRRRSVGHTICSLLYLHQALETTPTRSTS